MPKFITGDFKTDANFLDLANKNAMIYNLRLTETSNNFTETNWTEKEIASFLKKNLELNQEIREIYFNVLVGIKKVSGNGKVMIRAKYNNGYNTFYTPERSTDFNQMQYFKEIIKIPSLGGDQNLYGIEVKADNGCTGTYFYGHASLYLILA